MAFSSSALNTVRDLYGFADFVLQTYKHPMEFNAAQPLIDDKSPTLIAVAITLIILETTAVAVRFLSRYLSKAGFWWDDWLILGALVGHIPSYSRPDNV